MPKTVFTGAHQHLVEVLKEARVESGLKQEELAAKVGKDQTFISIIERGQRRVDVLEFVALARAMGKNPVELFQRISNRLPPRFDI
jgi:transcriptional regulator with XRE-family HTH domain